MNTTKTLLFLLLFFSAFHVWGQDEDNENQVQSIYEGTETSSLDSLISLRDFCSDKDTVYAEVLYLIGHEYLALNDYHNAFDSFLEAAAIFEEYNDSLNYAYCLQNAACSCYKMYDYNKSICFFQKALSVFRLLSYDDIEDLIDTLLWLALANGQLGNLVETYEYTKEYTEKTLEYYGSTSPEYSKALSDFAVATWNYGDRIKAIQLSEQALDLALQTTGKESAHYINVALNLAMAYSETGNYRRSLELEKQVIELLSQMEVDEKLILQCKGFMAFNYYHMEQYDEAIQLQEEVLMKSEQSLDYNSPEYATILHNLASMYIYKDVNKAIELEEKAIEIRKKIIGEKHITYYGSLNILASLYNEIGNYDKAFLISQNVVRGVKEHFGINTEEYTSALRNLADIAFVNHNNSFVCNTIDEYVKVSSNRIFSSFAQIGDKDRKAFWSIYEGEYLTRIPYLAYRINDPQIVSTAYNAILLGKGLLLNTEIEMLKIIQESQDSSIIKKFGWLQEQQKLLSDEYSKAIDKRDFNTDSLERIIKTVESELINESQAYGDFTHNLKITWRDVQKKLSNKDIAIEFVRIPINDDSTMYVAFVLHKRYNHPILIPLVEEKKIKELRDHYYTNNALAKLIWEPIFLFLGKTTIDNIYFSPAGELYNIAIEFLPHWSDSCLMSDKWNLYRLSSTRELAILKEKNKIKNAVLFGGIDYDVNIDYLIADGKIHNKKNRSIESSNISLADSLNYRKGASYLPATKIEVELINKTLMIRNVNTFLLIDTLATEGSFKDLSGGITNLLHIATHGFYWQEHDVKSSRHLKFLMGNNQYDRYNEDRALTRSGLLLAGANNALKGKSLPNDVDDGILTARDISQLDLRRTDLVVLSACQTGLGDITGDGVFGLQRGFKKAGVNSILMSLWQVDDNATQLLMTQFYENLTSGMGKQKSLIQAQKYVREHEIEEEVELSSHSAITVAAKEHAQQDVKQVKEYTKVRKYQDPFFWAAFILLDALD